MKKILLFLFMCLSFFLIYENCSALEPSEVNDSNIIKYMKEKYPDYFKEYYYVVSINNNYILTSFDKPIFFQYTTISGDIKGSPRHPTERVSVNNLILSKTDLSIKSNSCLNFNLPSSSTDSSLFISNGNINDLESFRNLFLYSNFDIYASYSKTIYDDIILIPKTIETEPEPELPPDIPAVPGDEGGVAVNDVIKVYMEYFLMGLPVALIMVSIEKFTEIFHNFVLGKMRK